MTFHKVLTLALLVVVGQVSAQDNFAAVFIEAKSQLKKSQSDIRKRVSSQKQISSTYTCEHSCGFLGLGSCDVETYEYNINLTAEFDAYNAAVNSVIIGDTYNRLINLTAVTVELYDPIKVIADTLEQGGAIDEENEADLLASEIMSLKGLASNVLTKGSALADDAFRKATNATKVIAGLRGRIEKKRAAAKQKYRKALLNSECDIEDVEFIVYSTSIEESQLMGVVPVPFGGTPIVVPGVLPDMESSAKYTRQVASIYGAVLAEFSLERNNFENIETDNLVEDLQFFLDADILQGQLQKIASRRVLVGLMGTKCSASNAC